MKKRSVEYYVEKKRILWVVLVTVALLAAWPREAYAVGEAATVFNVFVPPNNNNVHRDIALIVTAVDARNDYVTTVDIVDDAADGDDDDTMLGITLRRGESYVRFIKDGAVNDDAGGKWDGDYFLVRSDRPVVVSMSANSDWQYDFVPGDNKSMLGKSFYVYSPPTSTQNDRDLNVFAYEDNTKVTIYDITEQPKLDTGVVTVDFENKIKVMETTLNEGQDLIAIKGLGIDLLDEGRSFYVTADKPVAVQYGALYGGGLRDGGGFVPSSNGSSSGEKFYFYIPQEPNYSNEREVRIVSFDDGNDVSLLAWSNTAWVVLDTFQIDRFEHGDWIENGTDYDLYKLVCSTGKSVSVFCATWLEAKGPSGTKDIASFVSSKSGDGAGTEFLAYLPYPGDQSNVAGINGSYAHAYVFAHVDNTEITVYDADTTGSIINTTFTLDADEYYDVRVTVNEWWEMADHWNFRNGRPYLAVTSSYPIAVFISNFNDNWMTYVSSVQVPNPSVDLTADSEETAPGETLAATVTVENAGSAALETPSITVTLPDGLTYVSSSGDFGAGIPDHNASNGQTVVTWDGFAFPHGTGYVLNISGTVNSNYASGAKVLTGDILTLAALGAGVTDGESYITQDSDQVEILDPSTIVVEDFSLNRISTTINATWQTTHEHNIAGFKIYRSGTADGTYNQRHTGLIPSQGNTDTGFTYSFTDQWASVSQVYYLKLEAIDDTGNSVFWGPVMSSPGDTVPPADAVVTSCVPAIAGISMGWTNPDETDFHEVVVVRSTSGYPTTVTDGIEIYRGNGTTVTDTGAIDTQAYYYTVFAMDLWDNYATGGTDAQALATPVRAGMLAFEDLRQAGWNDWDYNDVLLDITTTYILSDDAGVASVEISYEILARGAGYDHEVFLTLPLEGTATMEHTTYNSNSQVIAVSTTACSGVVTTPVFASTHEALPPHNGLYHSNTLRYDPEIAGRRCTIRFVIDAPASNPLASFSTHPHDTWIHVVPTDVDIHRVNYAVGNTQIAATGPLAGRALPFVVTFEQGFNWPAESQRMYLTHANYVQHIISGQTTHTDWWRGYDEGLVWVDEHGEQPGLPNENSTAQATQKFAAMPNGSAAEEAAMSNGSWAVTLDGLIFASPVLRDLDGDDDYEVLIGCQDGNVHIFDHTGVSLPGWPQATAAGLRASPGVGDIDGDGTPDIVVGATDGNLYAWKTNGFILSGFPVQLGAPIKSVCAVVNLAGDDRAEIVVHTGDSKLHVLDGAGVALAGWPRDLNGPPDLFDSWMMGSSPAVFDLRHDGSPQIAVGSTDGKVYIFNADGTAVAGWPIPTADWVYPSITPVDLNGDHEPEIVTGSGDGKLYAWKADGVTLPGFPVELDGGIVATVAAGDVDADGTNELIAATLAGSVYVISAAGEIAPGWPQHAASKIVASPILVDVSGNGVPDIVVGSQDNRLYAWTAAGAGIDGFPVQVSDWIVATPAAGDLDGDGDNELVFGCYDRTLRVLDLSANASDAALPWPAFRGDRSRQSDAPLTDADVDGLPDAYEMTSFADLSHGPEEDADGDSHDNLSEWIAGTDANDAGDLFRIDAIIPGPNVNTIRLLWQGHAGRTYQVYMCDNLNATGTVWSVAGGQTERLPSDRDQPMEYTDDTPLPSATRFYRIDVSR